MMDKNKYKTLSIALEKETLEKLNEYCKGKTLKSIFVRRLIERELNRIFGKKAEIKTGKRIVRVEVNDYEKLREYAEAKKLGSVRTLLPFATAAYMLKYPLNSEKKDKNLNTAN